MTQSTLEPYLKTPDEIRLDNEAGKLEERYWNTTSESPNDVLARAKEFLSENKKSDIKHVRDVAILVDLIENGTANDRRNPANRKKKKVRLQPMNWNLLRTLVLIMRSMK